MEMLKHLEVLETCMSPEKDICWKSMAKLSTYDFENTTVASSDYKILLSIF